MATQTIPTSNAAVPASTVAKVKKAVTTPGAKGAKGFMLWAQAALAGQPKVLKAITAAAAKHVPATSPGVGRFGTFSFLGRAGRLGRFGQTGSTVGLTSAGQVGMTAGGYGTQPMGSTGITTATTASTPSTAGSSGWASDILQAVTTAGAAATTVAAIKSNLTAAQQGMAPYPYTVPSGTVVGGGLVAGMSPQLFWFMAAGAAALWYLGEKDKKRS